MKDRKFYQMQVGSLHALLKAAARASHKSTAARRRQAAAPIGSYEREEARVDNIREWYFARGIMFALEMLDGTANHKRRSQVFRPRPIKSTRTRKATV